MQEDDARREREIVPANDNAPALRAAEVDPALTRVAEAIGRHIAREHLRVRRAANDNEAAPKNPKAPKH